MQQYKWLISCCDKAFEQNNSSRAIECVSIARISTRWPRAAPFKALVDWEVLDDLRQDVNILQATTGWEEEEDAAEDIENLMEAIAEIMWEEIITEEQEKEERRRLREGEE